MLFEQSLLTVNFEAINLYLKFKLNLCLGLQTFKMLCTPNYSVTLPISLDFLTQRSLLFWKLNCFLHQSGSTKSNFWVKNGMQWQIKILKA